MKSKPIKLKIALVKYRLFSWIAQHEPTICYSCNQMFFVKDTYPERTTWGLQVNLCHRCHSDIITNYSDK